MGETEMKTLHSSRGDKEAAIREQLKTIQERLKPLQKEESKLQGLVDKAEANFESAEGNFKSLQEAAAKDASGLVAAEQELTELQDTLETTKKLREENLVKLEEFK